MGDLYRSFATFLQALLVVFGTLFYISAHPETLRLIIEKALQGSDVTIERVDGSLIYGFEIYGLKYNRSIYAKRVVLSYTPASLTSTQPTLEKLYISGFKLYPDRFKRIEKRKNINPKKIYLPPLKIEIVEIEGGEIFSNPTVGFDTKAKGITLSLNDIKVENIRTNISTEYGNARLQGRYKDMELKAKGEIYPSEIYIRKTEKYLKNVAKSYPIELSLDKNSLKIDTSLKSALFTGDANISIDDISLGAELLLKERYIKAKASYILKSPFLETKIDQSALVTLFGAYALKTKGAILDSSHKLPFKKFDMDAAGDKTIFMADTYAGPYLLSIYSGDYKEFALHLTGSFHKPTYIEHIPQIFSKQQIKIDANATARIEPLPSAEGTVNIDGNYSSLSGYFELSEETLLFNSKLKPKDKRGGIWESLPDPFVSKVDTFIYLSKEKKIVNLVTEKASLTLFEKRGSVNGWANIGSLTLEAEGSLFDDGRADIYFEGHITSLDSLMKDLNITTAVTIDAEVKSRFHLALGETFSLTYKTMIPWYLIETDSQHIYYGLDSSIEGSLRKNRITIDSYAIGFKDRRFDQNRVSTLTLDDNLTLHIEKFSILDTLSARGFYDLRLKRGRVSLKGKSAHYEGVEGKVEADVDITATMAPHKLEAEGEIFIKDALITYRPKKEYRVEDEDIVVIQDIKEPGQTKRSINIHIYSKKPLKYKIPEVTAYFIPDITLWKESGKPFGILGMVKLMEGSIDLEGKHFSILPSEIYFGGSHPINPYLDLHIGYELDFYRFNIYISHTLAKPLFLFSSEPPMSQNDIMSYILFGSPADEAFGTGGDLSGSVASLLLGSSLKKAIGGATGIKFDTINILSSQDGGFGIEIGKRLGKRLRILYRNDTVSSFIIQYRASRSIRIDIDVKDTGQGINILYVRDIGKIKGL